MPLNPLEFVDLWISTAKTTPTGGTWILKDGLMEIINDNGNQPNPTGIDWSHAAWGILKEQKGCDI